MRSAPEYIIRGGGVGLNPPYKLDKTQSYCFILEADKDALQKLCDRYLNIPGQEEFTYRPFQVMFKSYVFVVCSKIPKIYSTEPEGKDKGYFSEDKEIMFSVYLEAVKDDRVQHHAWFIPYIFVDSGPPLIMGREVYGFPKQFASIEIPYDASEPQSFSLSSLVLEKFAPKCKAVSREIVRVTGEKAIQREAKSDLEYVFRMLFPVLEGFKVDLSSMDRFLPAAEIPFRTVFLKQFQSVEDGNHACYQAIVEANLTFTGFEGGILGLPIPKRSFRIYYNWKFEIEITNFVSCPIVTDLGLADTTGDESGKTYKFQPALFPPFWIYYNFTLGGGKEIWRFGGN